MKTAVVLFNLGGPDNQAAVRPFLQNLFSDPHIIRAPAPLRWLLARLIARRRAPVAERIYARLGGGSPILANTEAQARALEAMLGAEARVFVAMRYWHPLVDAAAAAVKAWAPERIVLLPLYPQFSTTTTASSFAAWDRAAAAIGLSAPSLRVCCYPDDPGFVTAMVALIEDALGRAQGRVRLLFSAHGLPKRIVDAGDPYPFQIVRSVDAVMAALGRPVDHVICYQSRVGPLQWIGPSTEAEVVSAARDKVTAIVVPISFVSEHSETLVELDEEYRSLAEAAGAPGFIRVPTVSVADAFVAGLARLAGRPGTGLCSGAGGRICPPAYPCCPNGAPR